MLERVGNGRMLAHQLYLEVCHGSAGLWTLALIELAIPWYLTNAATPSEARYVGGACHQLVKQVEREAQDEHSTIIRRLVLTAFRVLELALRMGVPVGELVPLHQWLVTATQDSKCTQLRPEVNHDPLIFVLGRWMGKVLADPATVVTPIDLGATYPQRVIEEMENTRRTLMDPDFDVVLVDRARSVFIEMAADQTELENLYRDGLDKIAFLKERMVGRSFPSAIATFTVEMSSESTQFQIFFLTAQVARWIEKDNNVLRQEVMRPALESITREAIEAVLR